MCTVAKGARKRQLNRENVHLKRLVKDVCGTPVMIGNGTAMNAVYKMIDKVAPSDSIVLIQGESGTGKELVAQMIHQRSTRSNKPFVVINCATLQETLLQSELFGHVKGAFTGAVESRIGLFEVADGGTLFWTKLGTWQLTHRQNSFVLLNQARFGVLVIIRLSMWIPV